MPLRGLHYFSQLYQVWVAGQSTDLFGENVVRIPNPHYVIFYNGTKEQKDIRKFRLSDMFMKEDKSGEFEWTATAINVNYGKNESIQKKCKALYDYGVFIAKVREGLDNEKPLDQAVAYAVEYAISQKLLDGFFKEHKAEVTAVSLTEFDQELFDKCRRREGMEAGREEKAIEAAIVLIKDFNVTPELAAEKMGAPLDKLLEVLKS